MGARAGPGVLLGAGEGRVSATEVAVETVDLATTTVRELNQRLHDLDPAAPVGWRVANPNGAHAIAVGLDADVEVEIDGHVGYYCAGMNKLATVRVAGQLRRRRGGEHDVRLGGRGRRREPVGRAPRAAAACW